MKTIKSIIFGWDLWLSITISSIACYILPTHVKNSFAGSVYLAGLSILAITFSVFFAGITIIMTSTHDEFMQWLEKKKTYSEIIGRMKLTLFMLFFALSLSILIFISTTYFAESSSQSEQSKWIFIVWLFAFSYSLLATYSATQASVMYAEHRAVYFSIKHGDSKKDTDLP